MGHPFKISQEIHVVGNLPNLPNLPQMMQICVGENHSKCGRENEASSDKWGKLGRFPETRNAPNCLKILPKWGKKCHRFRRMPHFEKNGANGEKMPQVGEIQDSDPRFKRGYLAVSLLDSIGLDCCFICIAEQDPALRILWFPKRISPTCPKFQDSALFSYQHGANSGNGAN